MTRVIAHRGASRDRPENTIAAFDEALRQGCDGIEFDVQLSRDGVPFVYHDRTLVRAGGGRRRPADVDWRELRRLGPGLRLGSKASSLRLASLEEVLDRYAGRTRLLVEIKTRELLRAPDRHLRLARSAASLVGQLRSGTNAMLLSFDPNALDACADAAPDVPRVLNVRATGGLKASVRRRLDSLDAVSVDIRTLTGGVARAIRQSGTPLFVFTCNTPARVEKALEAGAVAIMSDRPGWLAGRLAAGRART